MTGFKDKTWVNNSPPQLEDDDLNGFKNEFTNTFNSAGITPSNLDLNQTGKSITEFVGRADSYSDSGAADAYVLSSVGSLQSPVAYSTNMRIRFVPANTNTGPSTVNVATLGVKNIKLRGSVDPAAGQLLAGFMVEMFYDGTNFIIVNNRIINSGFIRSIIDFVVEPINVTNTYQNATLKFFTGGANVSPIWPKDLLSGKVFMSWNLQGPGTAAIAYDQRILGGDGTTHFETLGTDGGDIGAANSQIDGILLNSGNSTNLDLTTQDLVGINFNGAAGGAANEAWNWQIKSQSGNPDTTPKSLRFIWVW